MDFFYKKSKGRIPYMNLSSQLWQAKENFVHHKISIKLSPALR